MTKEYFADNVPKAIESGQTIFREGLWAAEKTQEDGTYTLGLYTAPQVWCHILDALYFIGQQELPNSPVYKILDEAISARLGIKRKPQ